MQRANVRPEHVVPKRHAQVRVRRANHWTDEPSHLCFLGTCRQGVDEVAWTTCCMKQDVTDSSGGDTFLFYSMSPYFARYSPVWSKLGPVLRVGVPLDWICHFEPVSSDCQLQKVGSFAQPKSQANHWKAVQKDRIMCHKRLIICLITKQKICWPQGLLILNTGYSLELFTILITNTRGQQRTAEQMRPTGGGDKTAERDADTEGKLCPRHKKESELTVQTSCSPYIPAVFNDLL